MVMLNGLNHNTLERLNLNPPISLVAFRIFNFSTNFRRNIRQQCERVTVANIKLKLQPKIADEYRPIRSMLENKSAFPDKI